MESTEAKKNEKKIYEVKKVLLFEETGLANRKRLLLVPSYIVCMILKSTVTVPLLSD